MTSIEDLYKAKQDDNKTLFEEMCQQNKVVINYFETINNSIQDLLNSDNPDTKEIDFALTNLQKQLPNLSKLKFYIYETEDDIPDSLLEKWKKKVKYITKMMSINECETFLQELKEFETDIEEERKSRSEIEALYTEVVKANKDKLSKFPSLIQEIENAKDLKNIDYEKDFLTKLRDRLLETKLFSLYDNLLEFYQFLGSIKIDNSISDSGEAKNNLKHLTGGIKDLINYLKNISLDELWMTKNEKVIDTSMNIFFNQNNNFGKNIGPVYKEVVAYSYLGSELHRIYYECPSLDVYDTNKYFYTSREFKIADLLTGKKYKMEIQTIL